MRRTAAVVLALLGTTLLAGTAPAAGAAPREAAPARAATDAPPPKDCALQTPARPDDVPVLAHFYIWFTASSWNRAKTDYPAVGRYSSDQASVMREQVAQAKAAGIDGFIVSWKDTAVLDQRLATLHDIAADAGFGLAITYQAQDFNRHPLPVAQVRKDLEAFADRYADDPVFHVLGPRPLVAISGTWHYTTEELRSVTEPVASRLLVLATEKRLDDYERVAPAVEGELYYWSSGDPETTPGYQDKLMEMADAVRANCGVWVAPVAPGYDARTLGGERVVDRRDGDTLRASWEDALATVPHAIGVISWNEFSENTHVEPSTQYGARYLRVLSGLTGAPGPPALDMDSSAPQATGSPLQAALVVGGAFALVAGLAVIGVVRHRRTPA
jgi:hypothetical protein